MSQRYPRRSPIGRIKLKALALEERWLPSQTPVGPLERPYTFTEVMASIRSEDPLSELQSWSAVGVDAPSSRVILRNGDAALVEVRLTRGTDPQAAVTALQARPEVAWAEPNYIYIGDPRDFTPNDPQYGSQYHHTKMQNNLAWDVQTGNPAIVLAILDDGVAANHPDLFQNIWINGTEIPGNSLDDDGNGYVDDLIGWNFINDNGNVNPSGAQTHGTHVAGIAAARTNNAVGVAGVAGGGTNGDGIRLMPVRWYDGASWTAADVAASYTYAADNGAKLSNASYNFDGWASGGVPNATVASGLDYAYSKGMLILQSAGNSGVVDPPRQIFDQALFVASSDSADAKSGFSNYGQFVDITAPGSSILSTTTDIDGTVFNYANFSGTSMSTPDAAGVAALLWSHHPTWTRDQVVAQFLYAADNIDAVNPSYIGGLGTGRANSFKVLTQTLPPPKFAGLIGLPGENGVAATMPNTFYLDAPMRFNPATVTASKFELRSDGADGVFDTGDDTIIPITLNGGNAYRIGVGRLSFTVAGGAISDRYRFKASAGLLDPFGQALDGNGNGVSGDDFGRIFFVARQIEGLVYEDRNNSGTREASEGGLANRLVYLDTDGDASFDTATTGYTSTNVPVAIEDKKTSLSTLTISGYTGSVTDLNLTFSVTHTYDADMTGYLIGPTGAKITLFNGVGGGGDNFTNTILDDQATTSITAGAAPFTGSYRPQDALAAFNGLNPNGSWTLQIDDNFDVDIGSLDSWSLDVTTAEPSTNTDTGGLYSFNGLSAATYTVRHVLPAGWNAGVAPAGGAHAITITGPNDQFADRNFGELAADSIYGRFYNDANYSGSFNAGEALLSGWTAFLDGNGSSVPDSATNTFNAISVPQALPDLTEVKASLTVANVPGVISDLNVKLSINHINDQHLDVFLISPTGLKIELFTDVGGSGDNFTNTILDDQAAVTITAGSAPFSSTFRPEGLLAGFNGLVAIGNWQLSVTDDTAGTTGTLMSWSLTITAVEPMATSAADGTYVIGNVPAGSFTLRRVLQGGYTATQPAAGSYAVTMSSGQSLAGRDFGQSNLPFPPPPHLSQTKIDDGSGQRSIVRSITATFDQVVTLPTNEEDAFTLIGPNGAVTLDVDTIASTSTQTIAKLSFSGPATEFASLKDGHYALTVLSGQVQNASGQALDGDNNGSAGGNATVAFHRLYGDFDADASVAVIDFNQFRVSFGGTDAMFDFDNDGTVAIIDFNQFRDQFGSSI